ncbi:unnamed protein product [Chilo suppressalis]|uniref:Mitochondrial inner membrane protein Mpv17 n=1 Tax=Chilo suppressalis TaxID=168631 RepID=A0ABN8BE30_CHISP|nr:unnamed protein product [Chilo suppressalis]
MQGTIMKARNLFKLYQQSLNRRPYLMQAVQTGTLMAAGDLICQTFIEKKTTKQMPVAKLLHSITHRREVHAHHLGAWRSSTMCSFLLRTSKIWNELTSVFFSYGYNMGPALRVWYGLLNNRIGSTGKTVALKKVFVDQVLFAPAFLSLILVAVGALQGKPWETARKRRVNAAKWKKNRVKELRYAAKHLPVKPTCKHKCKNLQCSEIPLQDVRKFHESFYQLKNKLKQDSFLLKHVKGIKTQRRRPRSESRNYKPRGLQLKYRKNMPLSKIPDQSSYYSRQLYFYNFTTVEANSKSSLTKENVFAYCWTEDEFAKDANLIVSSVYHRLCNTVFPPECNQLRLMAVGCSGQNKNSMLIAMLSRWLTKDAPAQIHLVEVVLPVVGHSFLPPDRVFARIEKELRKIENIIKPEEYFDVVEKHATAINVATTVQVYDWKTVVKDLFLIKYHKMAYTFF